MYPYASFLVAVAYNILQTLEGIGVISSIHSITNPPAHAFGGFVLSIAPALGVTVAFVALYCLLLSLAFCLAGYCLAQTKGVLIVVVLLVVPYLLHSINAWPVTNSIPDEFVIKGVGTLGSPVGMAALASLGLVTGWVLIILATDVFSLQDSFRHFYDHFWYSMAIVGGIFFVADIGASHEQRALDASVRQMQQAGNYLLHDVRRYFDTCKSTGTEETISCRWASDIQQRLINYVTYDEQLYWQLGPKSTAELYNPFAQFEQEEIDKIRIELSKFNLLHCPYSSSRFSQPSAKCQIPPANFCTSMESLSSQNIVSSLRSVAISNECIIPALVKFRDRMERNVSKNQTSAKNKHVRWAFYILFTILAGGKVANATARLTKSDSKKIGLGDQRRLSSLFSDRYREAKRFGAWFLLSLLKFLQTIKTVLPKKKLR